MSSLVSCVTSPLNLEEKSIRQIYSANSSCRKITTITEENVWDGSFSDVKNRLKKSTYALGGNAFIIDEVYGQRRRTTAFVYFCNFL